MDYTILFLILMGCPLGAAFLMALLPSKMTPRAVYAAIHVIELAGVAVSGLVLVVSAFMGNDIFVVGEWFHIDGLSALFLGLIAVIAPCTGVYSLPYIKHDVEDGKLGPSQVKQYYLFYGLFVFSMILAVTSNNIIMMWVSVEATTLSTVFLVGVYRTKLALEAAWKYVIVCTAGVAFGMFGTLLIYANAADVMADAHQAVFWTAILPNAPLMDHSLMMIAFVFAAIGFGTKAGLFPMHTWLPDAHSEAPSPVSALLSGVLLKCAILIVLRFFILTAANVGDIFPQVVLLILGVLSVVYAAFEVYRQNDLKRKLAYSSCENIGLIAVCFGIGGPLGIIAGLVHCIAHGLTKALMFCLSGNVMMKYHTRDLSKISGIISVAPVTGVLFVAGCLALAGFPPFALFVSEMLMILAGVAAQAWWVLAVVLVALVVVIMALVHMITGAALGKASEEVKRGDVSPLALAPEVIFLALIVLLGVALPGPLAGSIEDASAIVMVYEDENPANGNLFVDALEALGAQEQPEFNDAMDVSDVSEETEEVLE
ncbi:hydrogenase 4 subunit F [Adlercreutzia murintestinalis]|uniref:hydrogenase 4 subunit F n=1 Tax=Adlercreutzia murintestinalis TaxID=2941325 RepID=UPI00203F09DD|nr:hydrogenase 4 subunit F [Adlercreutzia murintestinalis]